VAQVALVFVAHVFEQVAVGIQAKVFGDGPGVCVSDGVFDGDVDEQMPQVGASEPLGDDERFRVRVAVVVEPGLIIESGGSDYLPTFRSNNPTTPVEHRAAACVRPYRSAETWS
jgi:hypothetical protein